MSGEAYAKNIVCIDFGTACSGIYLKPAGTDSTQICLFTNLDKDGRSVKAPTLIAYPAGTPDYTFPMEDAIIGTKAKRRAYKNPSKYYLFRAIKKDLLEARGASDPVSHSIAAKGSCKTLTILAGLLYKIKRLAIKLIRDNLEHYNPDNVIWVMTVPAIAKDEYYRFLRKAAEQARYFTEANKDSFRFYEEPLAAGTQIRASFGGTLSSSENIAIFDIGGGTDDFVGVRVKKEDDGKVEMVQEPGGNYIGGEDINYEFKKDMSLLVSKWTKNNIFSEVGKVSLKLDIICDSLKKICSSNVIGSVGSPRSEIPSYCMDTRCIAGEACWNERNYEACIEKFNEEMGFMAIDTKRPEFEYISITPEYIYQLIMRVVRKVIHDAREFLMKKRDQTKYFGAFLCGGFAENALLVHEFKKLCSELGIVHKIPNRPSIIICEGGVLAPLYETTRITRYTYACGVSVSYTKEAEDNGGRIVYDEGGKKMINNGLQLHIIKNAKIQEDYKSEPTTSIPLKADQKTINFRVFRSELERPVYSTVGCEFIGAFNWEMSKEELAVPLDQRVYVKQFGYDGRLFVYITSKVTGVTRRLDLDDKVQGDL